MIRYFRTSEIFPGINPLFFASYLQYLYISTSTLARTISLSALKEKKKVLFLITPSNVTFLLFFFFSLQLWFGCGIIPCVLIGRLDGIFVNMQERWGTLGTGM